MSKVPLVVVVLVSFGAAALAVGLDLSPAIRGPLVLWALLGAPAPVVASRLEARPGAERWVLGVAAAAGVAMLGALVVLYAGAWSPPLLLVALAVLWSAVAGRRRFVA